MPLFRSTSAPLPDPVRVPGPVVPLSADDLLSPEDIAERRRRRRWLVALPLLALAAVGIGFGARPALHVAKAWQSRRTAAEAEHLIQQQRWLEARTKVQDAIQLWQLEPAAWRAAALFLGHTGNAREAAAFWHKVEAARLLTRDEQRDYVQALLTTGDLNAADGHLHEAWPAGEAGTPADWELGMKLAMRSDHREGAVELARRLLAASASTARQRFNAALVFVMVADKGVQAEGWAEIRHLAEDKSSPESLDALLLLAQRTGTAPDPGGTADPADSAFPSVAELIERIEAHPRAGMQQRLLAIDLRIAQDPKRRAEWVQSAIDRFAGTKDDADLASLARWLYVHGEFARVLEVLPQARAADDRALFFQRLDALAALDRWSEIQQVIESHQVSIDPVVEQMYLARCAQQLGESKVRDARWEAALDAAGTDPDKLLPLGAYAQKTGNVETALKAFRTAVQAAPESRPASEALLGALEAAGKTREERAALAGIAEHWPQDAAVRNDTAYLDALLGENERTALDTATELMRADPASLPHRVTLALAELRAGNNLAALDAFKGVDTSHTAMQPRQRAVLAAVLWATSYDHAARDAVRNLPLDRLLPEERTLVQPILEAEKPATSSGSK